MRLSYAVLFFLASFADADPAAGNVSLEPPGLQPLINKANALLSAGQFNEAARTYTEAIGTFSSPKSPVKIILIL